MSEPYKNFLAFLLEGQGNESTAVERGLLEHHSDDLQRITLTEHGYRLLLSRLTSFFCGCPELTQKQVLPISEILHFAQFFGGANFVDLFRSDFKPHVLYNIEKMLEEELAGAENESNNAYEKPYEANWRKKIYAECVDIISGYEVYMMYQASTLCFESSRVLPEKLILLLDALLLCNPGYFALLCKEKCDPVWPLRIIDRFDVTEPLNDIQVHDFKTTIQILNDGQQGVLIAHYWQQIQSACLEEFDAGLVGIFQILGAEKSMLALARITSDLSRDSFPSHYSNNGDKHLKMRKILDNIIRWMGGWINDSGITKETVRERFIGNLYGRVNTEARWVGLLLARDLQNRGSALALSLAGDIRENIISYYPRFWEKSDKPDSGLFFSGELSLELIEDLAYALILQGQSADVLEWLSNIKAVASPNKLLEYRDLHQYDRYFAERIRTIAHALLSLKVVNLYLVDGKIKAEETKGVLNFLVGLAAELPAFHHAENDTIILDELFNAIGTMLNNLEINGLHFIDEFLSRLKNSHYISQLLAAGENLEIRNRIKARLEQVLHVEKYLMPNEELLEAGWRLFSVREYDIAGGILDEVDSERLNVKQFNYWKLLKAQVFIQKALLEEGVEEQKLCLNEALKALDMSQKEAKHLIDLEDIVVLKLQVIGWLVDRAAMDIVSLKNAYNSISIIDAVNGRGHDNFSEGRQFVCALSLVRILGNMPVDAESIREKEMEFLYENMQAILGQEDVQALIRAWYADRRGKQEEALKWLSGINLHMRDQWLPLPLREFLIRLAGKGHE